jgi:hypothetical protein
MTEMTKKIEENMNRVFPNLRMHFAKEGSRLAEAAASNSSFQILCSLSPLCLA